MLITTLCTFLPCGRCFMNVTLQALVHNPLIRNYFLADMHNRRLCTLSLVTLGTVLPQHLT